ncbi:hypothetical protein FB645_005479 [Coemansia sp. IMI 203386]|nr:hypothetical protein FB645_005479 [Coemansia sp. IMI 203386]
MSSKGKQAEGQTAFDAVMPVIADLLEQGTRAFALENWEDAIDHFGQMASITEETFGSESPRYADALVMYGRALLQHAIEQNALLAQKTLAEAAAGIKPGEEEEEEHAPVKATIKFEGEPDFRQIEELENGAQSVSLSASAKGKEKEPQGAEGNVEDQENGANGTKETDEGSEQGEEEEDEEQDDFGAAWDVLDLARVIQSKATDNRSQLKYAETLMLLGDVSMESENFAQAVNDYTQALDVKLQFLQDDDRELAEIYYKVALAHEYNQDTQKALVLMSDVERILTNRLAKSEGEEKQSLEEVLDDVKGKIEEWKTPQKKVDLNEMTKEEMLLAEKAKEMLAKALEEGKINDITNLVRTKKSKRKAEENEADDSDSKKSRSEAKE